MGDVTYVGEEFEAAATINEYERNSREGAKVLIRHQFQAAAEEHKCSFGPIQYEEGIHQEMGPMLVGAAKVVAVAMETPKIVDDLSFEALQQLRAATRRVHQHHNPGARALTDEQCDSIIDQIAPDTMERMIDEQIARGRAN